MCCLRKTIKIDINPTNFITVIPLYLFLNTKFHSYNFFTGKMRHKKNLDNRVHQVKDIYTIKSIYNPNIFDFKIRGKK